MGLSVGIGRAFEAIEGDKLGDHFARHAALTERASEAKFPFQLGIYADFEPARALL